MNMITIGSFLFFLSVGLDPLLTLDAALHLPDIPFEATTFEQDDLVESLHGRRPELGLTFMEVCDHLIEDETAPFELRAWAFRKKLERLPGRQALEAGRAWLERYGDVDPHAIVVRYLVARKASSPDPVGENFFLYDELKAVYEDLFKNHSPANRLVIEAHQNFERALDKRKLMISKAHRESVEQAGKAVEAMRLLIESNDWNDEQREGLTKWLARLEEHYAKRLQEEGPSGEYSLEKETIERRRADRKLYNEMSELLREYLIEKGIFEPDEIEPSILNQNKYRHDPEFLKVWGENQRKKRIEHEAEKQAEELKPKEDENISSNEE